MNIYLSIYLSEIVYEKNRKIRRCGPRPARPTVQYFFLIPVPHFLIKSSRVFLFLFFFPHIYFLRIISSERPCTIVYIRICISN